MHEDFRRGREDRKEIEMLSKLRTRLRALLRKSEMERELDEELRHHIEQQNVAAGSLRRPRAAPGGGRNLRRDVLFG